MHKECSGVVFRLDSPCENKGFFVQISFLTTISFLQKLNSILSNTKFNVGFVENGLTFTFVKNLYCN